LLKLPSDCLTWHKSTLANKEFSVNIESSDRKYDVLCAVFVHPALTLLQESEQKAQSAC
jgi:hypothetical protein